MFKLSSICIAALTLLHGAAFAADPALAARIDATLAPLFKADAPGATVIVTKDGETVFRKAYGLAKLDGKVAMTPDAQMRLGSVTKQFTAVSILMLAEQGKLALSDDIRKHLPSFPDKGKTITIANLLNHTSGIVNYTSMPSFGSIMAKDLSVAEMIDFFKNEPLDFDPGTRWNYSNSGYFLLGAIIEKTSGMTYADYVAKHIFEPLGMQDSAYEGHERSAKRRVEGYSARDKGFVPAQSISMNLPYSAGSLLSTVDDLARWDLAVSSGKLLKADSWKQAFTACKLSTPAPCTYGYGWGIGTLQGSPLISHNGGIPGFSTQALRLPNEHVFVAVLTNTDSGGASELVAFKAAAHAIGKPYADLKAVSLDHAALDAVTGVYQVDPKTTRTIRRDGDHLTMQRSGRGQTPLLAAGPNTFFVENSLLSIEFQRDAAGKVLALKLEAPGQSELSPRSEAQPEAERVVYKLDPAVYDTYVGRYELRPGFVLELSRDGDKFMTQATGQSKVEIFPSDPTTFFAKVVEATLRMEKGADGKVARLVLTQNGREMPAPKIK